MPDESSVNGTRHRAKRLLTIREFFRFYGRSRSRTYELIRSGELLAVKEGRSTLIPSDAAEAWAGKLQPIAVRPSPNNCFGTE
jgi:excisionase family DNA binding protein